MILIGKLIHSTSCPSSQLDLVFTVIALLASISTQEFGQRIGRRNKNFGMKSSQLEVVEPRTGRQNLGYSYSQPDNPLLLPSSSNQNEQHQQITAIKSQPSQVVQQEIELEAPPLVVDISVQPVPEKTSLLQPSAQNFVPVQQPIDEEIAFWDFRESIPGEPELDYPIFSRIPTTSFKCDDKIDGFDLKKIKSFSIYDLMMIAGYYGDVETRCQVFHVCTSIPEAQAIKASFLCPNGTIFNQQVFVCQW